MLRELCSQFVGIFCWDKIFKKNHLKQYPTSAAGAMLKFCWDKIKIKTSLEVISAQCRGSYGFGKNNTRRNRKTIKFTHV